MILVKKNITANLVWTKGHSSDINNNIADDLATQHEKLPEIELQKEQKNQLDTNFAYCENEIIDTDLLSWLKLLGKNTAKIVQLNRMSMPKTPSEIDWRFAKLNQTKDQSDLPLL
jgi:hypothetical protein